MDTHITEAFHQQKTYENKHRLLTALDHLRSYWKWEDYFVIKEGYDILRKPVIKVEMHTGGWSQHEEIISDLVNTKFFLFYHTKWERGGHYYFRIPTQKE